MQMKGRVKVMSCSITVAVSGLIALLVKEVELVAWVLQSVKARDRPTIRGQGSPLARRLIVTRILHVKRPTQLLAGVPYQAPQIRRLVITK